SSCRPSSRWARHCTSRAVACTGSAAAPPEAASASMQTSPATAPNATARPDARAGTAYGATASVRVGQPLGAANPASPEHRCLLRAPVAEASEEVPGVDDRLDVSQVVS